MRIGILTFHRAINYGAVMQAYSLSKQLKESFPEDSVEIIDYNCKQREFFKIKCPLVFLYRRSVKEAVKKAIQTVVFNKFVNRLPLSKKFLGKKDSKAEKYINDNYDILIVGSDAVFNWNDIGLPNIYFAHGINTKYKLSYAASAHLQKYNDITDKQKEFLSAALFDFDYLGVRDENTMNFVANFADKEKIVHNCDPTVFLKMDFPEDDLLKKLKKHKFDFKKQTIFVMLMHPKYAKFVKDRFGSEYQIVALMDDNPYADIYLHDLNPFEWAHVFSYGSLVVTDYFHGTMLSLKNGTPVLSIDASGYCDETYKSKAYDLFYERLDMPEIYLNSTEMDNGNGYKVFCKRVESILSNFDKEEVYKRLDKESLSYFNSFRNEISKMHQEGM